MTQPVTILTENDLRQVIQLGHMALDVIQKAFAALSDKKVVMPPILSMELPSVNGEVDIKTAYIEGFDGFAIKVSPGFFDNPAIGLPSLNGLMMVLDAKTGLAKAVLLDNGYLTNARTAAAGGVAAKFLSPENTTVATVFGAGLQAELQLTAAHLVRPLRQAFIWARDFSKAQFLAKKMSQQLGIAVEPISDPAAAVALSQLVITTTPARTPIFDANWLHPNLHITAMGSDQAGKNEIDPQALNQCDLYVADRLSQCETLGELRSAIAANQFPAFAIPELGDIITGAHTGRQNDQQITICDLTGTGAQDTAIATLALGLAQKAKLGHIIQTAGEKSDQA